MTAVVGIDVGGTFTDLVMFDASSGEVRIAKVPTTTNQAEGVLAALTAANIDLERVDRIIHGTTATTNALLERKLAKTGLITTVGFRDVLELGRRTRPTPYGLTGTFVPLIPRELRTEVRERLDADGNVVMALHQDDVRAAARKLLDAGCESIVIHFLHSYRNPAHELKAAEIVRSLWPNEYVTMGHAVLSEYREYERGVAAAVNGSVQPVLHRYLSRLRESLKMRRFARELLLMQGNGGTMSAAIAHESAVNSVMSGPASGVIAAAATARAAGIERIITYDMGGTSSDVALIEGGAPKLTGELEIEYAMPVHTPMVDVHSIGAGGGSIARLDDSGLLRVGPNSAGARPGPICYGRGGSEPTITDANVLLGRLSLRKLLATDTQVDRERIADVFREKIARPLNLSVEAAAEAVIRIGNDKMAGAIRMVSLARGYDPRDFVLLAFGGAGPLHACALARELSIPRVMIPARPGLTNAIGCAVADLRHDFVRTVNVPLAELRHGLVADILHEQAKLGADMIAREGAYVETVEASFEADLQFQGQSHLLTISLPNSSVSREEIQALFEAAYWRRFEVELKDIRAVLVNLHTAVFGRVTPVHLAQLAAAQRASSLGEALLETRPIWFEGAFCDTPVYARDRLPLGVKLEGPALIEQLDTTIVIEPNSALTGDTLDNLFIRL